MTDGRATASLAVQRRREGRREEWNEQTKLAALLREYLDPARTYWTALENKPLSQMSGVFQRRRGGSRPAFPT
jgi:sulfur carrier protein ThiS